MLLKEFYFGFKEISMVDIDQRKIYGILLVFSIILSIIFRSIIVLPIVGAILVVYVVVWSILRKRKSEGLKGARITETFERRRYCVFDGSRMPLEAEYCSGCGNFQPSSGGTKECKNCRSMIPVVAYFCPVCGAFQSRSVNSNKEI